MSHRDSIVRAKSFQVYAGQCKAFGDELVVLIERLAILKLQITGLRSAKGLSVKVDSDIQSCGEFDVMIHRHEISDELKNSLLSKLEADRTRLEEELNRKLNKAESASGASSDSEVFNQVLDFLEKNELTLTSVGRQCTLSDGEVEVSFKVNTGPLNKLVANYFVPAITRLRNLLPS